MIKKSLKIPESWDSIRHNELNWAGSNSLKQLLRYRNIKIVLEVGCGKSSLLRHLGRENMEVCGCDISKHAGRFSKQILASATNLLSSVNNLIQ